MPQTPAVRKRRFVVSFHVDEKELSFLNRQVATSSLNREEYLRTLIAGKEIHPRPCTHHADLLRKVAGLCNKPTDTFPESFYSSIVSKIILHLDTHIDIKLRNGQTL